MTIAQFEESGRHYSGAAISDGHDVEVGTGRQPGMRGTLAATSDGWTDTAILHISGMSLAASIEE